jgi:hypothetical protein
VLEKPSDVFKSLSGIDPSLCMSLLTPSRTLDLVFDSPADFKQWKNTLSLLVRSYERNGVFIVESVH